jgi:hypothetical protein
MARRSFIGALAILRLASTLVAGSAVGAAQPKLTAGSKWTIKSEERCPIREIFGSPGHLTFVFENPKPHAPGKYKTSGKTITEKAPGIVPGPLAFSGRWSKTQNEYVGTLTNGVNHTPATLSPGVVHGCPT